VRPESSEYNYDWMLWRILDPASRAADGTPKERDRMYRYVPYFRGIIEPILQEGEVGRLFLKMLSRYLGNVIQAHSRGKKLAMTTFCYSPAVCYALDVVPLTLEVITAIGGLMWKRGTFDYLDYACELGFTETSCSAQRGSLGAWLAGLGSAIDFVLCDTPGVCDTNANAFAFASAFLKKPFYQLNYPQTLGDDPTDNYHLEDYRAMIRFMEEQTGKRLDPDRLREILTEIDKQDALIADLEDMHRLIPTPLPPMYNMFNYVGRFIFCGDPEYTKLLEEMAKQAQKNAEEGKSGLHSGQEKLRVYLVYIDHYTLSLNFWKWLDDRGIAHMGGILSRGFRDNVCYAEGLDGSTYGVDKSGFDAMINSLAQMNARLPMVRSIRGPFDGPNMWLEETLALAKIYNVDCMIYNGTPGCRNTWGMVKPFAGEIEKAGYPIHIMHADAFDDRVESWDVTAERLDEFFKVRGLL
jgi:hypothetical protein